MKNAITALLFCIVAAGASAEEFAIRPSVWGTQKWPGGYEIYNSRGVLVGEAKASVWGQEKWYGGYDVTLRNSATTRAERRALTEALKNLR
ncbi:MAG: hypothetical protein EBQ92_01740 [Proteobacteria bacterium]|nr:hypothetical protein [Pseudomonadota bacterium]